MHTKNVRMRPVPLWGRCTGSTDFTSRKKNTRKTNGATKQHSMRDQRQLWKSFSSSFASFEFTSYEKAIDMGRRALDWSLCVFVIGISLLAIAAIVGAIS